jgi:XTP/dITP diphosphohydrolase
MEELAVSWEAAKRSEKDRGSVMDGIARGLPALALAEKVLKKAASVGLEPTDAASAADALRTLLDVVDGDETVDDAALGRVAVELAGIARRSGIDAEMATRAEAIALAERVRNVEHRGRPQG